MPITARLSKAFYDRLGEEIVNELVDMLNSIEADSRSHLRELNELNFSRFEAVLNARVEGLQAKLNARIDGLEAKLGARMDALERQLEERLARHSAKLGEQLEKRLGEHLRWNLLTWATMFAAIVGLYMR